MDAIGAVYKKSTKQCTLEKRRNLLAELLCRETKEFEVCPLYYFVISMTLQRGSVKRKESKNFTEFNSKKFQYRTVAFNLKVMIKRFSCTQYEMNNVTP